MNIGIDSVSIHVGKLKLDLADTFAPAKGESPEKFTEGLGIYASSLPDVHEDIVTMGANAAHRLMRREGLEPADIGRIDVATETAFDNSKPVSTYIAGCLEDCYDQDFSYANKGERKFACLAGTQCLNDAYNWIKAGRNRGKAALVIATDTALYERGDPGEATQGAGAVAMLIDEDPDLVELSTEQGFGSADETDFLKPNQQFPSVDGKRSVKVYLARMREAFTDYEKNAPELDPDRFKLVPYHTPYPGMVEKAALLGYRHGIRDTTVEKRLAKEIGSQPRPEAFDDEDTYRNAMAEYTDRLEQTETYKEWYDKTVAPTLQINREVGNWYTGSVHLARISGLAHAHEEDRDLAQDKLLMGSYGSGAQAEIHTETIQPQYGEKIAALDIESQLNDRYDLSFEEYERIHDVHNLEKDTNRDGGYTVPNGEFVFVGWDRMGGRKYEYV